MGDCVDLRAQLVVGLVYNRVRKSIEVIQAKTEVSVRPTVLVFNQQVSNALELDEEGLSHCSTCMLGVVHRSVSKLSLGLRMQPVAHAMRARTRESASSPDTIAAFPERTSSRRERASCSQAAWAGDFGSKLAISLSTSFARSSGGRPSACAARSSTCVDMAYLRSADRRMPQQRGRAA